MKHTTRSGKPLMLMDSSELIDEIAHLRTKYDQVTAKNYRRKKALKQLNKFALVNHKVVGDVFRTNNELTQKLEAQQQMIEGYRFKLQVAHDQLQDMAKYAAGREAQAFRAGYTQPAERVADMVAHEALRPREVVTNTKPGFFRRMFGRTNRVGTT